MMSEDKISISLVNKSARTKIRVVRHALPIVGIIHFMHGRIRLSENAINDLNTLKEEFGEIMDADDQKKAFYEYRLKLDKKPWNKLGVNV